MDHRVHQVGDTVFHAAYHVAACSPHGGVTFDEIGDRLWIDRGRVDGQLRAAVHAQTEDETSSRAMIVANTSGDATSGRSQSGPAAKAAGKIEAAKKTIIPMPITSVRRESRMREVMICMPLIMMNTEVKSRTAAITGGGMIARTPISAGWKARTSKIADTIKARGRLEATPVAAHDANIGRRDRQPVGAQQAGRDGGDGVAEDAAANRPHLRAHPVGVSWRCADSS